LLGSLGVPPSPPPAGGVDGLLGSFGVPPSTPPAGGVFGSFGVSPPRDGVFGVFGVFGSFGVFDTGGVSKLTGGVPLNDGENGISYSYTHISTSKISRQISSKPVVT